VLVVVSHEGGAFLFDEVDIFVLSIKETGDVGKDTVVVAWDVELKVTFQPTKLSQLSLLEIIFVNGGVSSLNVFLLFIHLMDNQTVIFLFSLRSNFLIGGHWSLISHVN